MTDEKWHYCDRGPCWSPLAHPGDCMDEVFYPESVWTARDYAILEAENRFSTFDEKKAYVVEKVKEAEIASHR